MPQPPLEPRSAFEQIPATTADLALASDVDAEGERRANRETELVGTDRPIDALRREALTREHDRTEDFRDHFGKLTTFALYTVSATLLAIGAVWTWHLLSPEGWRWLEAAKIDKIQNLVTGGVLAGLIAEQFRRRIG